jgi:hypothetical protein
MGCSISRQALIFSLRQTQQSGSADPLLVSDPQTEHFTGFFNRSSEIDRFAPSSSSAGTTGSGFDCNFRLIDSPRSYYPRNSIFEQL